MNDQDALRCLLASLLIFTETQQLFSDEFWNEMTSFLHDGRDVSPGSAWDDVTLFYERLKEFAQQKGVQL
ncbi:MAG: hypothetical protein KJ077_05890 [Anaerolineae bacterium]|nr:hypothetical protein [Anaerolineae bacterium]